MTRRFAVAATAFVALSTFALHVPEAGAFTSVTKQCLTNARKAFQSAKQTASTTITSQYVADRAACFGPGQACANTCQTTLTGCVANPTADRTQCNVTCNSTFKTAVQACSSDPDPLGCATQKRIDRRTARPDARSTTNPRSTRATRPTATASSSAPAARPD